VEAEAGEQGDVAQMSRGEDKGMRLEKLWRKGKAELEMENNRVVRLLVCQSSQRFDSSLNLDREKSSKAQIELACCGERCFAFGSQNYGGRRQREASGGGGEEGGRGGGEAEATTSSPEDGRPGKTSLLRSHAVCSCNITAVFACLHAALGSHRYTISTARAWFTH
jgi:hypothetical protein